MNKITSGFCITPFATGVAVGLFSLAILSENFLYSVSLALMKCLGTIIGLILSLPAYFLLHKINQINLFTLVLLGMFFSLLVNVCITYLLGPHFHGGKKLSTIIFDALKFSVSVGALAGFFLWFFGVRDSE
ncbi:MAG: hypothetical protein AB8D52_09705 [Gammaproteobacteria bacterium]